MHVCQYSLTGQWHTIQYIHDTLCMHVVCMYILVWLTSAPSSTSSLTVMACPPAAAQWRGVYCFLSLALMSAPQPNREATHSLWPVAPCTHIHTYTYAHMHHTSTHTYCINRTIYSPANFWLCVPRLTDTIYCLMLNFCQYFTLKMYSCEFILKLGCSVTDKEVKLKTCAHYVCDTAGLLSIFGVCSCSVWVECL